MRAGNGVAARFLQRRTSVLARRRQTGGHLLLDGRIHHPPQVMAQFDRIALNESDNVDRLDQDCLLVR